MRIKKTPVMKGSAIREKVTKGTATKGAVMGHRIAASRPTWQAALLVAIGLSLPVFVLLSLVEIWI